MTTSHSNERRSRSGRSDHFVTTDWSLVVAAGGADAKRCQVALESLCQTYWQPLYAYARRRVKDVDAAQDLTQAFFARLLEKRLLAEADPKRGGFRAFLLTSFKRFLSNQQAYQRAAKRGGGKPPLSFDFQAVDSRLALEPVDEASPERLYDRAWALQLLHQVLATLREQYAQSGKLDQFDQLKVFLTPGSAEASYGEAARALQLSEGGVRVAVHRLRQRYQAGLRAEIARTVADLDDVDEEIASLFAALQRPNLKKTV